MTEPDAGNHYSMLLEWDPDDEIYVVTVPDLPGCRTHGKTYEEAAHRGQQAIESWIDAARADGDAIPAPRLTTVRSRSYSGLHRA